MDVLITATERMQMYLGDSWQYLLFFAALLFILSWKFERKVKVFLVGYSLLFWFVYLCPLTAGIIMNYCIGESVYWRMLWLCPMPLVIACAGTKLTMGFFHQTARVVTGIILAVCIALSGSFMYTPGTTSFVMAENLNKIPSDVVSICDQIDTYRDGGYACVTAPYELVTDMRQYDASFYLTYGRRVRGEKQKKLLTEMTSEKPVFKRIRRISRKLYGNYLVYPSTEKQHNRLLAIGYVPIGQAGSYWIYYDPGANETFT